MTREEIKNRVLECVDELNVNGVDNIVGFPIDNLLDEAAMNVLKVAPIATIDCLVDFSSLKQIKNNNGTGQIMLPDGFVKLAVFKMQQWQREVTITYPKESVVYKKQGNLFTRGGCSKPVVVVDAHWLYYYSVPTNSDHLIETAKAVVGVDPADNYPIRLIPALVWLTASKVLSVTNEQQAAIDAKNQFQEHLNLL